MKEPRVEEMDSGSALTSPKKKPVKIHKGNPGTPAKSGRQKPDVGGTGRRGKATKHEVDMGASRLVGKG